MLDEPALMTAISRSWSFRARYCDRWTARSPRARGDQQLRDGAGGEPRHSSSARLVRMIGTLRAEDDPGGIRVGEERQALGEHVARLQVGHDQHVGAARDRRDDLLDRRGLRADRIVERQRAVEHARR